MRALWLTIAVVATGCAAAARAKAVSAAAFDHDCPKPQVTVMKEAPDILAYDLDVCGKHRKYRNFGRGQDYKFVDVTDGVPDSVRAEP